MTHTPPPRQRSAPITAPAISLAATLAEAARRFGDAPAVVRWDGEALGYESWWAGARALAGWMARRGVGEGDRVALVLPSGLEYLIAYAAASALGAVTAGVNPSLAPAERGALVELVDPALVLVDPGLAESISGDRSVELVSPCEPGRAPCADLLEDDGPGSWGPVADAPTPRPDRTAALVFTSGTTGLPKAARFTEGALAAIARLDLGDSADRWGGAGPMFVSTQFAHVGLMTKLCWYLRSGARLHLVDRWRADTVLRLVAEQSMAAIGAVAPQVALMLRSPLIDSLDLSAMRLLIVGGAASPTPLVSEARRRFGAGYTIRYSSTETGGCGLATPPWPERDGDDATIGRPRPGIEASIRDVDGTEVPDGTLGELWIRTPSAMAGYWEAPEATAAALSDGWVRTGDLATRERSEPDRPGRYRLAGRRGDMYIRGGYNVFPAEVEAALADHPGVAQVAVVPRADDVMGEVGVAVVVPRPGVEAPDLESLRRHGARVIARHKLPEALAVRSSLPLGATGKIDRRGLTAQVQLEDEPGEGGEVGTPGAGAAGSQP
ncbi:MAG: class I adenylate-forming enzyme family protein [Microthrixaceae bacterium]